MAVKIRMKKMGRRHRPFFRVCVMDARSPRDGRVLEEVGHYDPMVPETDARAVLDGDRINYWIGVGAQPTDKVAVLIKKYGTGGTHLDAQKAALDRMSLKRRRPEVPTDLPRQKPKAKQEQQEEAVVVEEVVETIEVVETPAPTEES